MASFIWGIIAFFNVLGDEQKMRNIKNGVEHFNEIIKKPIIFIILGFAAVTFCVGALVLRRNFFKDKTSQSIPNPGKITRSGNSFTNDLGMKFVPVPCEKKTVYFCIHLTRQKDYEVFYESSSDDAGDE